jgi:hypothetical protein
MSYIEGLVVFDENIMVFDSENQYFADACCIVNALYICPDKFDELVENIELDKPVRGVSYGYKTSSHDVLQKDIKHILDLDFISEIEALNFENEKVYTKLEPTGIEIKPQKAMALYGTNCDRLIFANPAYFYDLFVSNYIEIYLNPKTNDIYLFDYYEDVSGDCPIERTFLMMLKPIAMPLRTVNKAVINRLELLIEQINNCDIFTDNLIFEKYEIR